MKLALFKIFPQLWICNAKLTKHVLWLCSTDRSKNVFQDVYILIFMRHVGHTWRHANNDCDDGNNDDFSTTTEFIWECCLYVENFAVLQPEILAHSSEININKYMKGNLLNIQIYKFVLLFGLVTFEDWETYSEVGFRFENGLICYSLRPCNQIESFPDFLFPSQQ